MSSHSSSPANVDPPSGNAETVDKDKRGKNGENQDGKDDGKKASRQRFKPQLSCTLCRNRKLKCDRQLPCGNCTKRGVTSSCTFVHGNPLQKQNHISKNSSSSSTRDVQSQIQHLEELVISMMNRDKNAAKTSLGESDGSRHTSYDSYEQRTPDIGDDILGNAETFGRISIGDAQQASYVGQNHWSVILDNIAGLKDSLEANERVSPEPTPEPSDGLGPDLLNGTVMRVSRAEILSSLPPRAICKALLDSFTALPDAGCVVLHVPTFMAMFEKFWADPYNTPILWIGLLYSVLSLSTQFEMLSGTDSTKLFKGHVLVTQSEAVDIYRQKSVQCLMLGNYTEPDQHAISTLIIYYILEHFRSPDAQFGTWMIFGMVIRAAMRLGFHRDPQHYPKISVLEGEMRRRLWDTIVFFDLQNSLQVGLPRMIREGTYDTQLPGNYLDEDFDENTAVLPPPRPVTDLTPIGYANCKHGVSQTLGRIIDQSNTTTVTPYHQIMSLDEEIHTVQMKLPPVLRLDQPADLTQGDGDIKFRRFAIELTYQKARCVLHRKYLFPDKATGTYPYPYSVKTCVDSAMRILESQLVMYGETLPGKPLHAQKWKSSSLITHDFLLAAMVVCLYVGNSLTIPFPELNDGGEKTGLRISWSKDQMLEMLNGSYKIWQELGDAGSNDATKAARTLKMMLERVGKARASASPNSTTATSKENTNVGMRTNQTDPNRMTTTPSDWSTQHSSSSVYMPPENNVGTGPYFNTNTPSSGIPSIPAPQVVNPALEFDWELWDTHFQPNNLVETPPELWSFEFQSTGPSSNGTTFTQAHSQEQSPNGNLNSGFDMQWDQS